MFLLFLVLASAALWASIRFYRKAGDAPEPIRLFLAVAFFAMLSYFSFVFSAAVLGKKDPHLRRPPLTEQDKIIARRHRGVGL